LVDCGFEVGLKMGIHLPNGWQESIASRARFILENSGARPGGDRNWFDLVEDVSITEGGFFYTWLALTGCYPDKFELQDFSTQVTIYGLPQGVQNVLTNRSKVTETARNLVSIELVSPKSNHLVDVTHTYSAPYLTGIQRVVFGVADGVKNISTFIWVGDSGIIQEKDIRKVEASEKLSSVLGWRIRLVHYLHAQVPKLDKSRIGTRLRILSLPLARIIKRGLVAREVEQQVKHTPGIKSTNLLLLNTTITIPEIPASLRHIYIYEAILEKEKAPLQIILYDFIPFFHAWTVHPGNRGHLNSYVRLVLLANRIVSISSLVQEQAKLITQAFRLERSEWSKRKQVFDYLALPSGLKPATLGEFQKQEKLIVMAGSLEPRKNHIQFLSALELLAKEGIRMKARILGSAGWENEHILAKIHDLQSKGIDIERLGNLTDSDMRTLIAEAQVLLQISEAEGFGLPIAEALALGTRVIVSDIRPLNDWSDSRVTQIKLGDIQQLKVELLNILKNPETVGPVSNQGITWEDWHQLLFGEKSTF
jgi:glycosyltransferase involved in cell wall biosynthesis